MEDAQLMLSILAMPRHLEGSKKPGMRGEERKKERVGVWERKNVQGGGEIPGSGQMAVPR